LPPRVVIITCFLGLVLLCLVVLYVVRSKRLQKVTGAFVEEAMVNATQGNMNVVEQIEEKVEQAEGQMSESIEDSMTSGQTKRKKMLQKMYIKIAPKLKIIVTFTQLVGGFGFVLNVTFPEPYPTFMKGLESIMDTVSLNLFSMAPVECFAERTDFFVDLVFSTMYPLLVSAVLLFLHMRAQLKDKKDSTFFSFFLALTYLILPGTASKIFSAFKTDGFCQGPMLHDEDVTGSEHIRCENSGGTMRYFVTVDYRFEQGTSEWQLLVLYAAIMVLIYAIGIPLLYIVMLYRSQAELSVHEPIKLDPRKLACSAKDREKLKKDLINFYFGAVTLGNGVDENTLDHLAMDTNSKAFDNWLEKKGAKHPAEADDLFVFLTQFYKDEEERWAAESRAHTLSFLLGSYEKRVYWFEVFEVFRRLMLSGVLILFEPGSTIQSAVSIIVCIASIKGYSLYAPFREDDDDFLQELTQWQLFMVLFCAILTRVDASADTHADQTYLGYLLVAFVVPGYIAMGWQIVKAYLDVFYEAYYEVKKTKRVTGPDKDDKAPLRRTCSSVVRGQSESKIGEGTGIDSPSALQLWEVGARNGDSKSIFGCGLIYRYGLGVEQNHPRARRLFEQAQSLGLDDAAGELAKMDLLGYYDKHRVWVSYDSTGPSGRVVAAEEGDSMSATISGAFSGGAEVATQSLQYVTGAFTLSEEGPIEVSEVSLLNTEPSTTVL